MKEICRKVRLEAELFHFDWKLWEEALKIVGNDHSNFWQNAIE